jgi:transposase
MIVIVKDPCKIIRCPEVFTTKTCGNCGCENDISASKKYICKNCNYEADRDWNAARNILIISLP